MEKSFLKASLLLMMTAVVFTSCDKDDPDGGENEFSEDLAAMVQIEVGDPVFTVDPGTEGNVFRVAWTGEKLWAITDIGGGDIPQKLLEIDTTDGSITQAIAPAGQVFSLDYANGKLWDINTFFLPTEQKYAKTYDTESGEATGQWDYSGDYSLYYYLTFDGSKYWGNTNYDCDGSNCQALVSYDLEGNVIDVYELTNYQNNLYNYTDLVYGGGYLWAYQRGGDVKLIRKLDTDLEVLESYNITDQDRFGEEQFGNEIAMHLEYIDGVLWVVDRFNNFYKTSIE